MTPEDPGAGSAVAGTGAAGTAAAGTAAAGSARRPVIVAGVSGSLASGHALRWAADEAARRNGHLHVVLVWSPAPRASYAPVRHGDREKQVLTASHVLAAALRAAFGPALPGGLSTEIAEGTPERVLVDRSAGADLLVLGSASAHALAGYSIGPVIRTCLSHAHCPVVVVGPAEPAGQEPAAAGGTGRSASTDSAASAGGMLRPLASDLRP
jgi:nucleotide-binding universal stress UspA family protein